MVMAQEGRAVFPSLFADDSKSSLARNDFANMGNAKTQ